MKNVKSAAGAAKLSSRLGLEWGRCWGWLVILLVSGISLGAQNPAITVPSPASGAVSSTVVTQVHGAMILDGPWRFQIGDDSRWADPSFDDSNWASVILSKSLFDQGFESYTGYAWYRMRVQPQQLAQFGNLAGSSGLDLLLTPDSVGQFDVYMNGVEAGHTRGMTDDPSMYQSPPLAVHVSSPGADGSIVVTVRTWAGPDVSIARGLLVKVELGTVEDIADRQAMAADRLWDEHVISGLILSFLFLCVAALGATLYLAQRHHSEYLWLALLCLSVAVTGTVELTFALALMPLAIFGVVHLWVGRAFMAVTLEFVLRFSGNQFRKTVRIVQISVLVLPIVFLLHLHRVHDYLSVAAEVVFCGLISVMLFRAWRRGLTEAGVMLLPFFLAATADSIDTVLDYAASQHWIADRFASPRFHMGPVGFGVSTVTYAIFLASLIAVILYRFVHVSQEEQKSAAEIEAARSVQALLIPTQLPSNRNFMLESAYLPVNGVGGDFFQVLPLKDDSLLIVVGDVSGKGLQAAMNASTLVGALRNELSHDPATVLNHLNHVMLGTASGVGAGPNAVASFATCLCARVYTDGTMTIANAGHLSPYRDGREMELVADLPLGVIANIKYEQASFRLDRGDRLIFLSDGVVEATNTQGELFGFERTQQVSNESARYIAQTAKRFGQADDITVVSMYFAASSAHRVEQGVHV
jgi:sigma-B regulation protein RsbU (phosphoserine phosphatase)